MKVLALFAACALISRVHCEVDEVAWCYHLPFCNDSMWPVIAPKYCNGTRQSPINIASTAAQGDSKLTEFTFHNYDNKSAMQTITNTGETAPNNPIFQLVPVKVTFRSGMQISGGGLSEPYDSLQFHLHWGNGSTHPGSEHTVDGKRYPMELHIVHIKSSYNGNLTKAVEDSMGLAALSFFIELMSGNATGKPTVWNTLKFYLGRITNKDDFVSISPGISMDDLLDGVDRSQYYRYLGSLSTPNCNEAVVWTVFKQPIKVSKDLIDLFSTMLHVSNSSSPIMINVYRNVQPPLKVTTQLVGSASTTYYSMGLLALSLFCW